MNLAHPPRTRRVEVVLAYCQRRLTWASLAAFAAAGLAPDLGQWARRATCGALRLPGAEPIDLTIPGLLLAYLLFTAALQVGLAELSALLRRPLRLIAGTTAAALIPIILLLCMAAVITLLLDEDSGNGVLTGLALVAAMPIAAAVTVRGSQAGGSHTLVVGLVLSSTLLSPLTIPLTLVGASALTSGDYSDELGRIAQSGGGVFALADVVLPGILGLAARAMLPPWARSGVLPWLKLTALIDAVLLTYTNASSVLGDVLRHPRPDLLAVSTAAAATMCAASFALGWCLARALRSSHPDTVAVTFATGMNNTSAGAVLATSHLPDHPLVLLPVLAYSLVQQVLAGLTDSAFARNRVTHGT